MLLSTEPSLQSVLTSSEQDVPMQLGWPLSSSARMADVGYYTQLQLSLKNTSQGHSATFLMSGGL